MIVHWLGLEGWSGYPLVIRRFEWLSKGKVVVHCQSSGTELELDWLTSYLLIIRLPEWLSNGLVVVLWH